MWHDTVGRSIAFSGLRPVRQRNIALEAVRVGNYYAEDQEEVLRYIAEVHAGLLADHEWLRKNARKLRQENGLTRRYSVPEILAKQHEADGFDVFVDPEEALLMAERAAKDSEWSRVTRPELSTAEAEEIQEGIGFVIATAAGGSPIGVEEVLELLDRSVAGGEIGAAVYLAEHLEVFARFCCDCGDGIFFSAVMSLGILLVGLCTGMFLCAPVFELPRFEPLAALGGAIWMLGNLMCPKIIQTIGLGLGLTVWDLTNMLTGWVTGYLGLLGLPKDVVKDPGMNLLGVKVVPGPQSIAAAQCCNCQTKAGRAVAESSSWAIWSVKPSEKPGAFAGAIGTFAKRGKGPRQGGDSRGVPGDGTAFAESFACPTAHGRWLTWPTPGADGISRDPCFSREWAQHQFCIGAGAPAADGNPRTSSNERSRRDVVQHGQGRRARAFAELLHRPAAFGGSCQETAGAAETATAGQGSCQTAQEGERMRWPVHPANQGSHGKVTVFCGSFSDKVAARSASLAAGQPRELPSGLDSPLDSPDALLPGPAVAAAVASLLVLSTLIPTSAVAQEFAPPDLDTEWEWRINTSYIRREHRRTDGAQNGSIGPWELLHRPSQDQRPYIERNPPKPPPDDDKPPDIAPEEFSADVDHTQERDRFREWYEYGKDVFIAKCAGCHPGGMNQVREPQKITEIIRYGKGTMPGFAKDCPEKSGYLQCGVVVPLDEATLIDVEDFMMNRANSGWRGRG
eukprot:g24462.t2